MEETQDKINPSHYKPTPKHDRQIWLSELQVIDIIELFDLNYHRGNVAKYMFRAGRKGELGYTETLKEIEDLEKSVWYLQREIERLKDGIKS